MDAIPPSETFGQDASFRLQQPIGSMSISPSGRDVVLASKEGLHIVDLDSPWSPPRSLPHRTPWEVADVQWSPFAIRDYWIVSTSNQKALVWNVAIPGWRDAIEFVLHGHTRAITDINFSAHHPDVLATCAVDSFVHGWDLRAPARPAFSFSDWFAGATQVKFSRQDEHVIASSHDRFLHIWDKRKGALPARSIEAHGTKIYGVDWNRFEPTKIVTCSLDKTIKFWNINDPQDIPERVIETPFPVWRARHTPFGYGLLAMPQRGSSDLLLYDRRPVDGVLSSGRVEPVTTFTGQKGQVKEFLWRARGTIIDGVDHRDFQLVSWSTDRELRLHSIHEDTSSAIGFEKGVSRPQRINFTRRNAKYRTFRDDVGELYSPLEMTARADSNQSYQQPFNVRTRPSTTIGMSKIAVAQFRGWLHGNKRERRTGMHGRSTVRQDNNPITWMKNVQIGASLGPSWAPDSLGDEMKQVGQRFKKDIFETVDIEKRKVVMSVQGPWGEASSMVYIRSEIRFPTKYPKDAAAYVSVYKNSSIDDETHQLISTELNTIAETYMSRQRGCVEAVVRYLLHEQSMEQIVSWLLDEVGNDSKLLSSTDIPDDLSSDSDDNLEPNQDPSSSSANIRMPRVRPCGALWSPTGELVCFFPQKSKEPESVLSGLGAVDLKESQSNHRLFEAFGRLQTSSPARRQTASAQPTVDDTSSEVSDANSNFSSSPSSSSESEFEAVVRNGFAPFRNTINLGMRQRSRSADRSNKSTTLDGTKAGQERTLNVVTIHYDLKDLLPSQKSLAEQYRISGPSAEVCKHNALVAEQSSLSETASVWHLLALVLEQRVPLRMLKQEGLPTDIAVILRQNMSDLRRKDSGVDLNLDLPTRHTPAKSWGNVKWGNNPLGSRYLITAIFNYFEKKADVQTLAMMSYVLVQHQYLTYTNLSSNSQQLSAAVPTLYQPSVEIAESILRPHDPTNNRFTLAVTRPVAADRLDGTLVSSIAGESQNKRRVTASVSFRPESLKDEESGNRDISIMVENSNSSTSLARTNAISTSLSPDESRFNRRANSGITFAASRASLNALAQSFQHSPPSNSSTAGSSLKKFSPSTTSGWAGSLFGSTQASSRFSRPSQASQAPSEANSDDASNSNLRGSISFANLQDLRESRMSHGNTRTTVSNGNVGKARKRTVKTSLHNQNHFDLDGHPQVLLIDRVQQDKHRRYRWAYADQLASWGLFQEQAELLKLEGITLAPMKNGHRNAAKGPLPQSQLEITRCCAVCGSSFAAIEKNGLPIGWHCTNTPCNQAGSKLSTAQVCSICEQIVRGLSVPCLQCGHLTCYECAQGWFAESTKGAQTSFDDCDEHEPNESEPGQKLCPTGCGCNCPTLQSIDVPYPIVDEDGHSVTTHSTAGSVLGVDTNHTILRQDSALSIRSQRHRSEVPPPGPDTALGAMMALSRSRAPSTTNAAKAAAAAAVSSTSIHEIDVHGHGHGRTHAHAYDAGYSADELVPWASGKFTSLGRGVGGGLSRGLSTRSSDATIRRA